MRNILINGGLELLQHSISRKIALRMLNACLAKKNIIAHIECNGTQWVINLRDKDGGDKIHLILHLSDALMMDLIQWAQNEIRIVGELSSDAISFKLKEMCSKLFNPLR